MRGKEEKTIIKPKTKKGGEQKKQEKEPQSMYIHVKALLSAHTSKEESLPLVSLFFL